MAFSSHEIGGIVEWTHGELYGPVIADTWFLLPIKSAESRNGHMDNQYGSVIASTGLLSIKSVESRNGHTNNQYGPSSHEIGGITKWTCEQSYRRNIWVLLSRNRWNRGIDVWI
ncbi:hypothetical protein Glove_133g9 [Diversispora epigaea]|uniref:Uncharacterized protein n=1 Tax=Diversispora epigaea TaxID=1348612 RepID=A0A397IXI4_9GLOM|nr:hypothetical protein Glove_133g9 [Diversispora epigaea]